MELRPVSRRMAHEAKMQLVERRGQSSLEYVMLIAVIFAAFVIVQFYGRWAISGRWRAAVDRFGFGVQYDCPPSECDDGTSTGTTR